MSNKFIWVRNPTALNGLSTLYVSKRGSDTLGDGSAQNPYASIAKITSVALANTNIMIDDGEWNEARTANNIGFHWWGNGKTIINLINPLGNEEFNFLTIILALRNTNSSPKVDFYNCRIGKAESFYASVYSFYNCIIREMYLDIAPLNKRFFNSIILLRTSNSEKASCYAENSIIIAPISPTGKNNNLTTMTIPTSSLFSINNASTGQTFTDYFNHYDADNWDNCDFTAKAGSENIKRNIGLNQGYPCRADNTETDIFAETNGAILRGVQYSSDKNGYILSHKSQVCGGATANTITFSNEASTEDDYYNGLFVTANDGTLLKETHYITDYDGATRTATIEYTFTTVPNTTSEYSLSGTITSAVKDFGKAIKIKRNWTFQDVFANDNGEWAELLTHVTKDGKIAKISSFKYKYSVDGSLWRDSDDLVSATDGETKTQDYTKGDCSEDYNELLAKPTVMRYVQFFIHIGVNN